MTISNFLLPSIRQRQDLPHLGVITSSKREVPANDTEDNLLQYIISDIEMISSSGHPVHMTRLQYRGGWPVRGYTSTSNEGVRALAKLLTCSSLNFLHEVAQVSHEHPDSPIVINCPEPHVRECEGPVITALQFFATQTQLPQGQQVPDA